MMIEDMADRVSWLLITTGWKVLALSGDEVGAVDEVVGDDTDDIFDGLAIATSALGKPRYVTAEQVVEITDGTVRLSLTAEQVAQLDEYLEPATSAVIEPDSKGGFGETLRADLREVEGKVAAPIAKHEQSMGLIRRMGFFFKRLRA